MKVKISCEIDLSDLPLFDDGGHNFISLVHDLLVCATLEKIVEELAADRKDFGPNKDNLKTALVQSAKDDNIAATRVWNALKMSVDGKKIKLAKATEHAN